MRSLLLVLVLIIPASQVSSQKCLGANKRGSSDPDDPPFNDDNNRALPASPAVQAIIPTYKFNCNCVNITSWETYLQPGGRNHYRARVYDITFQVWRPSPTVTSSNGYEGYYSLVGENVFTRFTFSVGGYVHLSPTPPSIITAQSGDVVGYYTNSRDDGNQGIQLERDSDYTVNIVWYNSPNLSPNNLMSIGHNGLLQSSTFVAPMLKISTTRIVCSTPMSEVTEDCLPSSSLKYSHSIHTTLDSSLVASTNTVVEEIMSNVEVHVSTTDSTTNQNAATSENSFSVTTTSSVSHPSIIPSAMTTGNGPYEGFNSSSLLVATVARMISSNVSLLSTPASATVGVPGPSNEESRLLLLVVPVVVAVVLFLIVLAIVLALVVFRKMRSSTKIRVKSNPCYSWAPSTGIKDCEYIEMESVAAAASGHFKNASIDVDYEDIGDNRQDGRHQPQCQDYTYVELTDTLTQRRKLLSTTKKENHVVVVMGTASPHHDAGPDIMSGYAVAWSHLRRSQQRCSSVKESDGYAVPLDTVTSRNNKNEESWRNKSKKFENVGFFVLTEEERGRKNASQNMLKLDQQQQDRPGFFLDEPVYWAPASTTSGIYSQLAKKKYREIPRSQIRLENNIGSGQFGEVCKALWSVGNNKLDMAVKTLKRGSSEKDKVKLLQEAAIMGQFSHINVIKLHGVVTLGEPVLICLEILELGDLRQYLLNLKPVGIKFEDFQEVHHMFLKFSREIAAGMAYLSGKSFVHRDLAARNVLLNKYLTCKIADFGMARDLMDDTYYTSSGGKIPVKWTAPEALLYMKYSTDSDIWSYGMVLFEIWSVGKKPFSSLKNSQILELIQKGFCQAPPPGCPRSIYSLMVDCWNPSHQSRPSFSAISRDCLSKSTESLLHWSPEDGNLSPGIGVCGSPLAESFNLYSDLQKKYM